MLRIEGGPTARPDISGNSSCGTGVLPARGSTAACDTGWRYTAVSRWAQSPSVRVPRRRRRHRPGPPPTWHGRGRTPRWQRAPRKVARSARIAIARNDRRPSSPARVAAVRSRSPRSPPRPASLRFRPLAGCSPLRFFLSKSIDISLTTMRCLAASLSNGFRCVHSVGNGLRAVP